jgi:hypothetical protein
LDKSFLIWPLQEVPIINIVRKVKALVCRKYFFIIQLSLMFLSICLIKCRSAMTANYPILDTFLRQLYLH